MADEAPVEGGTVRVNGRARQVHAEDDTALLYVLRNHLGLKGTRFGCGLGVCGGCFVLVDGHPVYSCDTPLRSVAGKEVTTVEGLGTDGEPHPVARAIVEQQAAQCGYCMSGIVVSAAGLLATNPDPSESEVRAALDDNLCRCGAHNRVVRAVLMAAAEIRRAGLVTTEALPPTLAANPRLGNRLRIHSDGVIEIRSGKVELGQGVLTALAQVAAEGTRRRRGPHRDDSGDNRSEPGRGAHRRQPVDPAFRRCTSPGVRGGPGHVHRDRRRQARGAQRRTHH